MPTEDRSELSVKASFGVSPDDVKVIFPVHGGFLGKVYTTGMPIVVTDPKSLEESRGPGNPQDFPPGEFQPWWSRCR
jgi:hypothetical protein